MDALAAALHGVAWFLGLTTQNDWPYMAWSGLFPTLAALFDFGLLVTVWRLWRQHHRLMKEHHELLRKHLTKEGKE